MSVDVEALVGYGYVVPKNKIDDALRFADNFNFWDFLDDNSDSMLCMNAYDSNPYIFIGKQLTESDLRKLVYNSNIVADWQNKACKMYQRIFGNKQELPPPEFIIGEHWY